MVNKKGTGLFLVYADVPAEAEEEFNRWYSEEHIVDLLAIPGILSGARYEAIRGGPKYLACYELESLQVLESGAWLKHQANPSEWSKKMNDPAVGVYFIAGIYQQIFPAEVSQAAAQRDMAPTLQIGRMNVPPEMEDEFNEWYDTIYVPNYEKVPGCISGRRYRLVTDVLARGEPKYATVYEQEHDKVSQSPEWTTARESHAQNARIRAYMTHASGSAGVYKKIFPK